jgi:DNA-binding CsgD family transcriptional regulator
MTETSLSERELELLELVATGASNKEISQQLQISVNTVKVHMRNIFTKLEVSSRTEAAMWAVQNGVVEAGVQGDRETEPEEPAEVEAGGVGKGGSVAAWFTWVPLRQRFWILGAGSVLLVIIGFGISQIAQSVQEPDLTADVISASEFEESRWKQLADMPTARAGFAAAVFDNHIYAIAGHGTSGVLGVVERYDPLKEIWETLNPKPVPVVDVKAGVIGGLIYVPGGRLNNNNVTNILEIFNPNEGVWTQGTPLPKPISAYGLATFEGKMYVFGGWNGKEYTDSVFMYDPDLNIWTDRTPMPSVLASVDAVVVNDFIYVIGGKNWDQVVSINEVYSPISDSAGENPWSSAAPLPQGWQAFGVVNVAENIFVLSSNTKNNLLIHEFATQKNEWRKIDSSLRSFASDFSLVALGPDINILGGLVGKKLQAQNTSYQVIYTISIPIVK